MIEPRSPAFDFAAEVANVLEQVRPALKADGGDIELLGVDEARGRVEVRLTGACTHCASSLVTLTHGVEARLRQEIPGVREVVAL